MYREIPDEELWEDGELERKQVIDKIIYHILEKGDWLIVREES